MNLAKILRAALTTAALGAVASPAFALSEAYLQSQINASMARMNNIVARANAGVAAQVQRGMANPMLQQQYQGYAARMQASGQRPMNFATYVYYSQYTRNFSAGGIAAARANESNIQAAQMQKYRELQYAQQQRAAAMQNMFAGQQRIANERGNLLMGNSTYSGGQYGGQQVLPHTWGANTYHSYNGNNYYVDPSGQYWQQGNNGYYYSMGR